MYTCNVYVTNVKKKSIKLKQTTIHTQTNKRVRDDATYKLIMKIKMIHLMYSETKNEINSIKMCILLHVYT